MNEPTPTLKELLAKNLGLESPPQADPAVGCTDEGIGDWSEAIDAWQKLIEHIPPERRLAISDGMYRLMAQPPIPVSERLPECGARVLAFYDSRQENCGDFCIDWFIAAINEEGLWFDCDSPRDQHTEQFVTHWLPMPSKPRTKDSSSAHPGHESEPAD
jgi:hypothetical protein